MTETDYEVKCYWGSLEDMRKFCKRCSDLTNDDTKIPMFINEEGIKKLIGYYCERCQNELGIVEIKND